MTFFETIAVAFSMYSAIPMPQFEWNEKNMRYALCAFPIIGLIIGLLCWGWWKLSVFFNIPVVLRGALLCLIPVFVTGGIHLDGYSDTCDALASHQAPEKKQEILKDPHVGSFAVIHLCGYFILMFALWTALPGFLTLEIIMSFCLSRCLSGLAVATFPLSKKSGLAYTFAEAADKKKVRIVLAALSAVFIAALILSGFAGAAMAAAALIVFCYYYSMAKKEFGGLSGDLAGWFLQQCEKWMLIALTAVEFLEAYL